VFPACQGGPHNNTIAGVATALLQASQPSWKAYAQQVIKNAQALADELIKHGYKLQTGGTDNHLVLWDLRPLKLTGSKVEKMGDLLGITINSTSPRSLSSPGLSSFFEPLSPENAVSGDASAQVPGGIRIGTAALTSRDMREDDLRTVANFLHRSVQLALLVQKESGSKLLKDFVRCATVPAEGKVGAQQVTELRREVRTFAKRFPLPGISGEIRRPAGIEEDD
jgi:glycine hydroxymethyltransferase